MAQLKDTVVAGSLRATDTLYATTLQTSIIKAPSSSSGSDYAAGTAGYVLKSGGANGKVYWADSGISAAIAALDSTLPSGSAASKTLTALTITDGKMTAATFTNIAIAESQVTNLTTDLAAKAPLASPALTGTPTAPTAAATTNSTQIATTAFVMNAFTANDAMVFKGVVNAATDLPASHSQGWTYKVATAGTYAGKVCEIGDMIICVTDGTSANNDHWAVIQNNVDGAIFRGSTSLTDSQVIIADGTSGKVKTSGYTIAKSVPSNAVFTDTQVTSSANHYTPSTASGSDKTASATGATADWSIDVVKGITINTDGKGHITGLSVTSGKIPANPNTDTKVNMIARGTTKAYLLATSTAPTSSAQGVTALAEIGVYLDTTAGKLVATSFAGNGAGLTALSASNISSGTLSADRLATSGVTANTYGNTSQQSPAHGNTFNIPYFTVDNKGRVTAAGTTTVKLPSDSNTDTLVKQTSQTAASELKLLSTVSASPSSGSAAEAGYDTNVTINPSTHTITASSYKVTANALITYNSATGCLEITV